MTEAQKQYYLNIFNKMMEAQAQHGDCSPQFEQQRAKLGGALKRHDDLFTWLWEQLG